MKNEKTIFIRVDYGENIGLGHIRRCEALGNILNKNKWRVYFFIKRINSKKIDLSSKSIFYLRCGDWSVNKIKKHKIQPKIILLDLDHAFNYKNFSLFRGFVRKLSSLYSVINWDKSVISNEEHNLFTPYFNYTKQKLSIKNEIDHKYIPLDKKFFFKKRKIQPKLSKIIINLGGAIKNKEILKLLKDISPLLKKITIYIFYPREFTKNLNIKIIELMQKNNFKVELVYNYKKFHTFLKKADLGIISSGYTKYESMASSLPTIIFQTDKKHNIYNIPIEKKKIALVARSKLDLKKKLKLLIKDSRLREKLSLNSSKTFKSDNEKFVIEYFNSIYKNANY